MRILIKIVDKTNPPFKVSITPSRQNQMIGSFKITNCQKIDDLGCLLTTALHIESGARILHLGNADPENLFCLTFTTPALNSHGLSHILEHCVLCGSEKYRVKDPFFSMARRSLNTFMNAFTGSDFTCYPAASQERSDFYNLLDVYLDAVFYPRLNRLSFLQEGIRRSLDEKGNMRFDGIVFNEMKGAYALAEKRLFDLLLARLLPKTSYRYDSGGDPKHIPKLTLKSLRNYHKNYYHPSRCLFFFYGNIELEEHLDFLQKNLLHKIVPPPVVLRPISQPICDRPNYLTRSYPASGDGEKSLFGISWRTSRLDCIADLWIVMLLDELLMGSDAAPLKRQLIEQRVCQQVQSSLEAESPQIAYCLILKGCSIDRATILTEQIVKCLTDIAKIPFGEDQVLAAIHRMELQHLEIESGQYPYGLTLFWRAGLSFHYGADPLSALSVANQFQALKQLAAQPIELTLHLHRLIIDNKHRSSVVLRPDCKLADAEEKEELERLKVLKAKLSLSQKRLIEQQTAALKKEQSRCEDISCLPLLPISAISPTSQHIPLTSSSLGDGFCHYHRTHTNGFVYIDCFIPLQNSSLFSPVDSHAISSASLWRLFSSFLPSMGAAKRSFAQNSEQIAANSGGIYAEITHFSNAFDEGINFYLHLRIKGLKHKLPQLFALLYDTIANARFDDATRLEELLSRQNLYLEQNQASHATSYAIHAASCAHSKPARRLDGLGGFGHFKAMRSLFQRVDKDPRELELALLKPLCQLQQKLPSPEHLAITCDESEWRAIQKERFYGLDELFRRQSAPFAPKKELRDQKIYLPEMGFPIHSQVATNAFALPGLNFAHTDFAKLQLLSQLLQHKILHPQIREKGGAYGSGALCRADWRSFIFYSARDPNIAATRAVFDRALNEGSSKKYTDQDLDEAKRGMIQQLDTPIQPGNRAAVALGWRLQGKDWEMRNEHRQSLLTATAEQVRSSCKEHLFPHLSDCGFASASERTHLIKEMPQLALYEL